MTKFERKVWEKTEARAIYAPRTSNKCWNKKIITTNKIYPNVMSLQNTSGTPDVIASPSHRVSYSHGGDSSTYVKNVVRSNFRDASLRVRSPLPPSYTRRNTSVGTASALCKQWPLTVSDRFWQANRPTRKISPTHLHTFPPGSNAGRSASSSRWVYDMCAKQRT